MIAEDALDRYLVRYVERKPKIAWFAFWCGAERIQPQLGQRR